MSEKNSKSKYTNILLTPYKEYIMRRISKIKKIIIFHTIALVFVIYGLFTLLESLKEYLNSVLTYPTYKISLCLGLIFIITGYVLSKLK